MYKRRNSGFKKRVTATSELGYGYKGKPEGDAEVKDYISKQALRDLPHSSYSISADPFSAALPTSEPYPVLNKFNSTVGGRFSGDRNIDGGNVQQYANSTESKMLNYFDSLRTKINVNYRFLPVKPQTGSYPGKALIDEMRKSLAETASILQSTTYTQMAINKIAVVTDLPMGDNATKVDISRAGDNSIMAYTGQTNVLYACSIYYQIFWQNILNIINWFNSFKLKQGVMIKNAWNREVPMLNTLFGLLNKKSFTNLLDTICLSFEGEYIDKDFMEQINVLTLMPSRRSDSITDPVLELQIGFNHPSIFKMYYLDDNGRAIGDSPFFDDSQLKRTISIDGQTRMVSIWDACDALRDQLSLQVIQAWARSIYEPGYVPGADNLQFNNIKAYLDVLNTAITLFKPYWADYREALDTMTRTGAVSWSKGFRPGITNDTYAPLTHNLTVDSVFHLLLSGANKLEYDNATKRFRSFSLWNMYNGIPLYDTVSGGSFLTLSFKEFTSAGLTSDQYEYLPLIFEPFRAGDNNQIACTALARDSKIAVITASAVQMRDNIILDRLAPLPSQDALEIRVPTIAYTNNSSLTPSHFSTLYKTLTQVFGLCRIQSSQNGVYDVALDPDILAIYQIELADVTNSAITYARANAPFRGTTSDQGNLGFTAMG